MLRSRIRVKFQRKPKLPKSLSTRAAFVAATALRPLVRKAERTCTFLQRWKNYPLSCMDWMEEWKRQILLWIRCTPRPPSRKGSLAFPASWRELSPLPLQLSHFSRTPYISVLICWCMLYNGCMCCINYACVCVCARARACVCVCKYR